MTNLDSANAFCLKPGEKLMTCLQIIARLQRFLERLYLYTLEDVVP